MTEHLAHSLWCCVCVCSTSIWLTIGWLTEHEFDEHCWITYNHHSSNIRESAEGQKAALRVAAECQVVVVLVLSGGVGHWAPSHTASRTLDIKYQRQNVVSASRINDWMNEWVSECMDIPIITNTWCSVHSVVACRKCTWFGPNVAKYCL